MKDVIQLTRLGGNSKKFGSWRRGAKKEVHQIQLPIINNILVKLIADEIAIQVIEPELFIEPSLVLVPAAEVEVAGPPSFEEQFPDELLPPLIPETPEEAPQELPLELPEEDLIKPRKRRKLFDQELDLAPKAEDTPAEEP